MPVDPKTGQDREDRRVTTPMTNDVRRARDAVAQADKVYTDNKKWLAEKAAKINPKDKAAVATLAKLKESIEADHTTSVAAHRDVLRRYEQQETSDRAAERNDLKPVYKHGEAAKEEADNITTSLKGVVDNKGPAFVAGPLRKYDTEEKQKPIRDLVSVVAAHNRRVPLDVVTNAVLTSVTHLGDDDVAKKETMNGQVGENGSRFKVVGRDVNQNPVIVVGTGDNQVKLNLPQQSLNTIKRLKKESWQMADKEDKEAAKKEASKKAAAGRETKLSDIVSPPGALFTKEQREKYPESAVIEDVYRYAGAGAKYAPPNWPNLVAKYGREQAAKIWEDAHKYLSEHPERMTPPVP